MEKTKNKRDEAKAREAAYYDLIIGQPAWDAALREIQARCRDGERPRFIFGAGTGGVLAAFEDRCVIVKKGGLTSFMARATSGGRTTTLQYVDITSIEVNTCWRSASIEILTLSHDAGGEQDARKMPNVLMTNKKDYAKARERLDWMRQRIAEAKRPVSSTLSVNLAAQIRGLAQLHAEGVLTHAEFAEAKAGVIAGNA